MTASGDARDQALQDLCEKGQEQLIATDYLAAETTLVRAEAIALSTNDFETLARLYMPLQEARRQRRQVCGEGEVILDLVAGDAEDILHAEEIIARHPHGQLLVAGWGSIEPAKQVRKLAQEGSLYLETYLAAAYPVECPDDGRGACVAVLIVPNERAALPALLANDKHELMDALRARMPAGAILMDADELPDGDPTGSSETFAYTMDIWERLAAPFLAAADATADPRERIAAYRRTIDVDYACELAHQRLSFTARDLARGKL